MLQWNLKQWTPPIMEISTMWTKCCGAKSFPILYYSLRPPYSGNLPTPNYGHRSHIPTDKINTNILLKVDTRLAGVKDLKSSYLLSLNISAVSIHSTTLKLRPLCIQGVLNLKTLGIQYSN